jgi:hypothetical protein
MECGEMQTECIKEALTVEEAVDAALEELGVQQDAVDFEVLEEPASRRFGLGTERNASVRVWIRPSYIADLERSADPAEAEEALPAELQAATDDELSEEDWTRSRYSDTADRSSLFRSDQALAVKRQGNRPASSEVTLRFDADTDARSTHSRRSFPQSQAGSLDSDTQSLSMSRGIGIVADRRSRTSPSARRRRPVASTRKSA